MKDIATFVVVGAFVSCDYFQTVAHTSNVPRVINPGDLSSSILLCVNATHMSAIDDGMGNNNESLTLRNRRATPKRLSNPSLWNRTQTCSVITSSFVIPFLLLTWLDSIVGWLAGSIVLTFAYMHARMLRIIESCHQTTEWIIKRKTLEKMLQSFASCFCLWVYDWKKLCLLLKLTAPSYLATYN